MTEHHLSSAVTEAYEAQCAACRLGRREECAHLWDPDGEACPPVSLTQYLDELNLLEKLRAREIDVLTFGDGGGDTGNQAPKKGAKGFSGYIHPDAWRGDRNIGELKEPSSTGRKRVAEMYPIPPGQMCEWARLKHAGGGLHPIVGCIGNAATDLHHGPDKNTLCNEKASWGCGDRENIHLICSFCHNAWHAANDPDYDSYDRKLQQAEPWLPRGTTWDDVPVHDSTTHAHHDELMAVQQKRLESEARHGGGIRRGRQLNQGERVAREFDDAGDTDGD